MASPVTIQPSGADVYLREQYPDNNYSSSTQLIVAPETSKRHDFIILFDFSASIPAGATITLSTLSLYTAASLANRTITAYRLRRTDWVEAQATWNIYKTGSNWGTAGALNTDTDIITADAASATSVAVGNWLNETVTAQIQTALDSVNGIAHFLVADEGATAVGNNTYPSKEYTTDSLRPKLYIEYTVPSTFIPKCVFF